MVTLCPIVIIISAQIWRVIFVWEKPFIIWRKIWGFLFQQAKWMCWEKNPFKDSFKYIREAMTSEIPGEESRSRRLWSRRLSWLIFLFTSQRVSIPKSRRSKSFGVFVVVSPLVWGVDGGLWLLVNMIVLVGIWWGRRLLIKKWTIYNWILWQ